MVPFSIILVGEFSIIIYIRVFKDALSVDAAHHDMIDSSAGLYASLSWHCLRLWIKDERLMILRDSDLSPVLPYGNL